MIANRPTSIGAGLYLQKLPPRDTYYSSHTFPLILWFISLRLLVNTNVYSICLKGQKEQTFPEIIIKNVRSFRIQKRETTRGP